MISARFTSALGASVSEGVASAGGSRLHGLGGGPRSGDQRDGAHDDRDEVGGAPRRRLLQHEEAARTHAHARTRLLTHVSCHPHGQHGRTTRPARNNTMHQRGGRAAAVTRRRRGGGVMAAAWRWQLGGGSAAAHAASLRVRARPRMRRAMSDAAAADRGRAPVACRIRCAAVVAMPMRRPRPRWWLGPPIAPAALPPPRLEVRSAACFRLRSSSASCV